MDRYPKDVKLVIKHFPLNIHKFAKPAAIAALAANKQDKFWEFHNRLFENYRVINNAKITEIAQKVGLDMETFTQDRHSQSLTTLVNRDLFNGRQAGVRGTPTVYINGKVLKNRSFKGFERRIEAELKKAKNNQ